MVCIYDGINYPIIPFDDDPKQDVPCTCECHDPIYGPFVDHVMPCCNSFSRRLP